MNIFDIIIAILLLFGFVRGLMKGLFVEIASLLALILGVYGAIHFSYFAADFLKESVSWEEKYISITAFAITFLVIVIVISLLGKLLTKVANFVALGMINKLLGGVFGTAKIAIILSVIFLFFEGMNDKITFIEKETIEESILYKPIKEIVPTIFPFFTKEKIEEKIGTEIV